MQTPIEDRFEAKIDRQLDGCWLWTGATMRNGYGVFKVGSSAGTVLAHRFSYEIHVGPIPDGMQIDHVRDRGCTNRHCVNPAHLEAVPQRENLRRGDGFVGFNSRKTRCPNGHPYDAVYDSGRGKPERTCTTCQRRPSANVLVLA